MIRSANYVRDAGFRLLVIAAAVAVGGIIARVRFSGVPPLPPRPPMPTATKGTAEQLLHTTLTSPAVWRNFLQTDARAAGLAAETPEQMAKVLVYHRENTPHVLSFAAPAWSAASLDLALERGERGATVLALTNRSDKPLAYRVTTRPGLGTSACNVVAPMPINALVIGVGQTVRRAECAVKTNTELSVFSVETIELSPLQTYYIQQVSPLAVGLEPRWAISHRPEVESNCSSIVPQAVRTSLQRGELTWRDLIDFYARHRCETYQFPLSYRAFTKDGERELPALPETSGERRN